MRGCSNVAALAALCLAGACTSRQALFADAETPLAAPAAFSRVDLPGPPVGDGVYSRDGVGAPFTIGPPALSGGASFRMINSTRVNATETTEDPATGRPVSVRRFTATAGGQEPKAVEFRSAAFPKGSPFTMNWLALIPARRDAGVPEAYSPPPVVVSHSAGPSMTALLAQRGCSDEPAACATAGQFAVLTTSYASDSCVIVQVARGFPFTGETLGEFSARADADLAIAVSVLADTAGIRLTGPGVALLPAGLSPAARASAALSQCADPASRSASLTKDFIDGRTGNLTELIVGFDGRTEQHVALQIVNGESVVENFACFNGPGHPCPTDTTRYALPSPLVSIFDDFRFDASVASP